MEYTEGLELKKLELSDAPADITEINENWEIINRAFWAAEKSRAVLQEQIYKNQRSLRQIERESNTITLNNSKKYPFNNSLQTISLAKEREKLDYQVHVEVLAASGGFVKEIEVKDKQTNGFKLGYTGSATSVQVRYIVEGGYY